jgi:methyl coenzyme M reductase beta subunit
MLDKHPDGLHTDKDTNIFTNHQIRKQFSTYKPPACITWDAYAAAMLPFVARIILKADESVVPQMNKMN